MISDGSSKYGIVCYDNNYTIKTTKLHLMLRNSCEDILHNIFSFTKFH